MNLMLRNNRLINLESGKSVLYIDRYDYDYRCNFKTEYSLMWFGEDVVSRETKEECEQMFNKILTRYYKDSYVEYEDLKDLV